MTSEVNEALEIGAGPKSELIPDQAIAPGDNDLFDHGDYVARLLAVLDEASTSRTSANIALYGPWGSGKSGVANLLQAELEEGGRHHFLNFDAFKYARTPLLRHFIRHLADELLPPAKAKEYRRRLYAESSDIQLNVPDIRGEALPEGVRSFIKVWSRRVALTLGVALFALTYFGGLGTAIDIFGGLWLAFVPSAVLVAVLGLIVRYLTVTTTLSAPDSDEQFEDVFQDILTEELKVGGASETKLIVFIDELDRCAPHEVAETLETIRTFLGVPGCYFIVAADQRVLEHALTLKLRQATPPDPTNPYYSAGHAYLDKIFQYQLSFPPLLPTRITDFALKLLDGRGGTWEDIDKGDVVSVLLPTHVHSPRRVKVLLNSFALAYRVAKARSDRKQLDEDLSSRATELAKLVCLRNEFPLFARDLSLDDRLTEAVVRAAELIDQGHSPHPIADEELGNLPLDIASRAVMYAQGDLPVATLLGSSHPQPVKAGDGDGGGESAPEDARAEVSVKEPMQRRQAVELVRYLEKTVDIDGPRSDLVHLEAAGAVFDMNPQTAQQIVRDALDNQPDGVASTIKGIADPDERLKALQLLGQQAHKSVGHDAGNVVRALLAAIPEAGVPIDEIASELIGEVEAYRRKRDFNPEDLAGALLLALATKKGELVEALLGRDEALGDAAFRRTLLGAASDLQPEDPTRLGAICAREMTTSGDELPHTLSQLDRDRTADLLRAASPHIVERIERAISAADSAEGEGHSDTAQEFHERNAEDVSEVAAVVRAFLESDRPLSELALVPLIDLPPRGQAQAIVSELIAEGGQLQTPEATVALIRHLRFRPLEDIPSLLRAIDPDFGQ